APAAPIVLDGDLALQTACVRLVEANISSAPVRDTAADRLVGMLDFRDIATYIVAELSRSSEHLNDHDLDVAKLVATARTAPASSGVVTVKQVMNFSGRDPLVAVSATAPLVTALRHFVEQRVQRLCVVHGAVTDAAAAAAQPLVGVFSQSTLIALIASEFGHMPRLNKLTAANASWPTGDQTLEQLGLAHGDVISVTSDHSVLDALRAMLDHGISSIAIVGKTEAERHRLVGSLSMSDVKHILAKKGGLRCLFENAFAFFARIRYQQGVESGADRVPSFTVKATTTLIAAIERLAATRVHRLWVEKDGRLTGVLSLSDILPL
ncbi:CBS-domain-containing protein, partial [Caulochytrium protostelioides]